MLCSSLSSVIDWNDDEQITRHIRKQKYLTSEFNRGKRMSEYFGALNIDQIDENMVPVSRIQDLFENGLGIKIHNRETP